MLKNTAWAKTDTPIQTDVRAACLAARFYPARYCGLLSEALRQFGKHRDCVTEFAERCFVRPVTRPHPFKSKPPLPREGQ